MIRNTGLAKVAGSQLHDLAGLLVTACVLPEDRREALRAQDRVHGVFEHEDLIGDGNRERSTGVTLTGDDRDDRHMQAAHGCEIPCDGLPLSVLLCLHARIGTRRIDEGDDRTAELLGLLHEAECLTIALRTRHTEIEADVLFHRATLAVTEDGHRHTLVTGDAAIDGRILIIEMIPLLLEEVGEEMLDEIVDVRALRMTGQIDAVRRREIRTLGEQLCTLLVQTADFLSIGLRLFRCQ